MVVNIYNHHHPSAVSRRLSTKTTAATIDVLDDGSPGTASSKTNTPTKTRKRTGRVSTANAQTKSNTAETAFIEPAPVDSGKVKSGQWISVFLSEKKILHFVNLSRTVEIFCHLKCDLFFLVVTSRVGISSTIYFHRSYSHLFTRPPHLFRVIFQYP